MRIVAISDTHDRHSQLEVPDGDVLVHAGDITRHGSPEELLRFVQWLGCMPHSHKVVIAGNHDRALERSQTRRALESAATYLEDSGEMILGCKFWGSPSWPGRKSKAFFAGWEALPGVWAGIPDDVDVLITHGPPAGILDGGHGCPALRTRVGELTLACHIFGHIHEGHGAEQIGPTRFVNASSCRGDLMNAPQIIDL